MSDLERDYPDLEIEEAEAQYWIDELALARAEDIGRAVVNHHRLPEAVIGAVGAGASAEEVINALVAAGAARRTTRLRDRIPIVRSFCASQSVVRVTITEP